MSFDPIIKLKSMDAVQPLKKSVLRTQLRANRNALSDREQCNAAQRLFLNLRRFRLNLRRNTKVGLYLASDGEISLQALADYLSKMNIDMYLPALCAYRPNDMVFLRYTGNSQDLNVNQYKIGQPKFREPSICSWMIDYLFMPLVGFDLLGNRLGMGGGYYDRLLAHRQRWPRSPKLYGVAHDFQKLDDLGSDPWDIPLDGVITDRNTYYFSNTFPRPRAFETHSGV